jgi:glycosyltransferase involved in cell wall biosynthesis
VESCPRFWTLLDSCRLLRRLALGSSSGEGSNGSGVAPAPELGGVLGGLRREVAALLAFPDEARGWVCRAALRARGLLRRFQPQVVVSSGPPHAAHLVAGLATMGSATRWFIDLRDPWGGPLKEAWAGHARIGTRVFRTLSPRLERLAFRAADGVITNTHQLAAVLAQRYPEVPMVCVPNGIDPEGLPATPPQRYPGLSIAYAGTLYAGRDLSPVVRALQTFLARHPDAARAGSKLRIAGRAEPSYARALHDAVAASGLQPHVEVVGPLPRVQALQLVSRSRLALVLAQEQDLQIPAKLYESVAMGVQTLVLAPAHSAAAFEGKRVGALVCDAADVEGMACLFEHVWRDGVQGGPRSPVPISYEGIAVQVDRLFRSTDSCRQTLKERPRSVRSQTG